MKLKITTALLCAFVLSTPSHTMDKKNQLPVEKVEEVTSLSPADQATADAAHTNNRSLISKRTAREAQTYAQNHPYQVIAGGALLTWFGFEYKWQWNNLSSAEKQRSYVVQHALTAGRTAKSMVIGRPAQAYATVYAYIASKLK